MKMHLELAFSTKLSSCVTAVDWLYLGDAEILEPAPALGLEALLSDHRLQEGLEGFPARQSGRVGRVGRVSNKAGELKRFQ